MEQCEYAELFNLRVLANTRLLVGNELVSTSKTVTCHTHLLRHIPLASLDCCPPISCLLAHICWAINLRYLVTTFVHMLYSPAKRVSFHRPLILVPDLCFLLCLSQDLLRSRQSHCPCVVRLVSVPIASSLNGSCPCFKSLSRLTRCLVLSCKICVPTQAVSPYNPTWDDIPARAGMCALLRLTLVTSSSNLAPSSPHSQIVIWENVRGKSVQHSAYIFCLCWMCACWLCWSTCGYFNPHPEAVRTRVKIPQFLQYRCVPSKTFNDSNSNLLLLNGRAATHVTS